MAGYQDEFKRILDEEVGDYAALQVPALASQRTLAFAEGVVNPKGGVEKEAVAKAVVEIA